MKDYFITIILLMSLQVLIISCDTMQLENQDRGSVPSGLHAVLYSGSDSFRSSREGRVNAMIVNSGNKEVTVDMWNLGQPMLALDVFHDGTGERMLTAGPATPRSSEEMKKYLKALKPGEKIEISYTLHIFSPELPRGTYKVRMASIPSNSVLVIIR